MPTGILDAFRPKNNDHFRQGMTLRQGDVAEFLQSDMGKGTGTTSDEWQNVHRTVVNDGSPITPWMINRGGRYENMTEELAALNEYFRLRNLEINKDSEFAAAIKSSPGRSQTILSSLNSGGSNTLVGQPLNISKTVLG